MKTKIAVYGAAGRVGQLLTQKIVLMANALLSAALVKPEDPRLGQDASLGLSKSVGIALSADLEGALAHSQVVIDFSTPYGTSLLVPVAIKKNCPMVIGTTGFDENVQKLIDKASLHIPILQAANTSVGVNALQQVAGLLSKILPNFDVELFELHHRRKKDSPSGTGLELARTLAESRGLDPNVDFRYGRHGQVGARTSTELGILSARGGDCVGEHTIFFLGNGERIEITHRATDRGIFAQGAIDAAQWLVGKPPGLYSMQDMLHLG